MKRVALVLGVLLLIVGLVGLIHPDFHYQKQEEVARIGPVQATVEKDETATVPAAVSVVLLVAGIALTILGLNPGKMVHS